MPGPGKGSKASSLYRAIARRSVSHIRRAPPKGGIRSPLGIHVDRGLLLDTAV